MSIFVEKLFDYIFLFFLFEIMILSSTLILTVSQLQTQKMMMSQIMLHIEYLLQTYNIFCAHFVIKIDKKI